MPEDRAYIYDLNIAYFYLKNNAIMWKKDAIIVTSCVQSSYLITIHMMWKLYPLESIVETWQRFTQLSKNF